MTLRYMPAEAGPIVKQTQNKAADNSKPSLTGCLVLSDTWIQIQTKCCTDHCFFPKISGVRIWCGRSIDSVLSEKPTAVSGIFTSCT